MPSPVVEGEGQRLPSAEEKEEQLQQEEQQREEESTMRLSHEDDALVIEDVKDDDGDDEDGDDDDEVGDAEGDHEAGADDSSKQSRSEKKSRKAMMKLGMKPVTGASRITLKRTKTPHVFKSPNSDTYENLWRGKNRGFELQAAQQFRILDLSNVVAKVDLPSGGLEPRDIDLVMTQAGVSRAKAVKALKTNNGDIVSAIIELTA